MRRARVWCGHVFCDEFVMSQDPNLHVATVLSHCTGVDAQTGAVVPALQPSTTYARDAQMSLMGGSAIYTRAHNATDDAAETVIAHLEGAEVAALFGSGMAAAAAIVQTLKPGARILAPKVMYWSLRSWLQSHCQQWGMELSLFDAQIDGDLERQLQAKPTDMLWLETPSNPTWDIIDLRRAIDAAKAANAMTVVDNTVSTPLLTQPLALGADLVFHSATKYLNGHSDVLAGVVVSREDNELWQQVLSNRSSYGGVLGPFESWLLARGLRTLHLRVAAACQNAQALAEQMQAHPQILEVLYPGLPSHPGHEIAARQMQGGFGAMLSLRIRGGAQAAERVASRCRLFIRATSLGGTESLIEHRGPVEGPESPIPADLLRLSIGCEALEDLLADLHQALAPEE